MRVITLDLTATNGPIAAFAKEALADHPKLPNPAGLVTRVFGLRSLSVGATTKHNPTGYDAANVLMNAAAGVLGVKYGISGTAIEYGMSSDTPEQYGRTVFTFKSGQSVSASWNNHGVCKNFDVGPDGKMRLVNKTLVADNLAVALKLYDGEIDPQLRAIGQKALNL